MKKKTNKKNPIKDNHKKKKKPLNEDPNRKQLKK